MIDSFLILTFWARNERKDFFEALYGFNNDFFHLADWLIQWLVSSYMWSHAWKALAGEKGKQESGIISGTCHDGI